MYSELYRIPYEWGGIPVFGWGVLLAVWALASTWTVVRLVKRHGFGAETWNSILVLLAVGVAIAFLPRLLPDGIPIRSFGLMVVLGAAVGIGLAMYRAGQVGLDRDVIISLALVMFLSGVVCARAFYVVEYWDSTFRADTWWETMVRIVAYTEGGLVVYGALLGATGGFIWFVRREGLPALAMADLVAPSLAVGLALGRIGCLMNSCCHGGPSSVPWAVSFPKYSSSYTVTDGLQGTEVRRFSAPYVQQGSQGEMHGFRLADQERGEVMVSRVDPGSPADQAGLAVGDEVVEINGTTVHSLRQARDPVFQALETQQPLKLVLTNGRTVTIPAVPMPERSLPVHPTQIYSSVNAGLLAWFLWAFYPFRTRDGQVIALLLTIYPVSRFLLEIIRVDESAVFGTGLSISQNVSLIVLLGVVGLWIYLAKSPGDLAFGTNRLDSGSVGEKEL